MDKEQLTARFAANRHSLLSFIYAFVRNMQDAEDILQEVWLRFFGALERGAEIHEPERWCRGTAKNLILHHWRDRKNARVVADSELLDLVELAFVEHEPEVETSQARQRALLECIQMLPEKSKRLLRVRYDEGQPMETIARLLNQSAASVMMALSRIRGLLRQCIKEKLKSPGFAE